MSDKNKKTLENEKKVTAPTKAGPSTVGLPTKKEPQIPQFEKSIVDKLLSKFGSSIKLVYAKPLRIKVSVDPSNLIDVALFTRDVIGFDHAEAVTGIDFPKDNQLEVVYQLGSYSRDDLGAHIMMVATRTSRDEARLPSLINVFKSVEYHERETYEMLGVYFEGHPRNERFLLPEDWADIPPLRRDFRIKGR